ncbi:MAG: hypothetical protein IJX04_11525 [Oscillospiraceae bacterium]|nr:hypothetical protein [Oscillospiraceae bacterium]
MMTIKRLWLNIPRKARICVNILAILLLVFTIYILLGCPAFTAEQQFRRLEKANLVGPAEIIEVIDPPNGEYDHIIVADDGDGVILYSYHDFEYRWAWAGFFYREKSEGITVFPAPNHMYFGSGEYVMDVPVLVFHDYPDARRAELELTFDEGIGVQETRWENGEEVRIDYFEKTYLLEAVSDIPGYFRFDLHAQSEDWYVDEYGLDRGTPLGKEGIALQTFCRMMNMNRAYLQEYVNATVRLYDGDNTLLVEEELTIRSVADERYAREEGLEP